MNRYPVRIGRLPVFHRYSAYSIFILCSITGLSYLLGQELDFMHAWLASRSILISHGVSAFLILIVIGSVLPGHIKVSWRARRNRLTGLIMGGIMLILSISALFLYYGSEESRDLALWAHWLTGIAVFIAFPLHVLIGRWRTMPDSDEDTR